MFRLCGVPIWIHYYTGGYNTISDRVNEDIVPYLIE